MNNKVTVRQIATTGIMSALAAILMMLEFSLPFVPSFLKFDFSDLPAFITSFALGPVYGGTVELIKNLIHLPFTATSGIGELANFIVGAAFVIPAGIIYKHKKTQKNALLGSLAGAIVAAVISFPVNYFITYPVYSKFMPTETIISLYNAIFPFIHSLPVALITVNLPFTLLKGIINTLITFLVYKKLSPIIKGNKK